MKQMYNLKPKRKTRRDPHSYSIDEVFSFIVAFKRANDGLSPSLQEMMDFFDISARSVAKAILDRLVKAGKIKRLGKGTARGIAVVGGRWSLAAE